MRHTATIKIELMMEKIKAAMSAMKIEHQTVESHHVIISINSSMHKV